MIIPSTILRDLIQSVTSLKAKDLKKATVGMTLVLNQWRQCQISAPFNLQVSSILRKCLSLVIWPTISR
jgi:hypothetical protein